MIELTIPAPVAFLNLNDRLSWRAKAKLTREWRDAAILWARHGKLPKGLDRVRIDAHLSFVQTRRRDAANWHPTVKAIVEAIVDGLVDYGLIPDDNAAHLDGPFLFIGEPSKHPVGDVHLTITEVPRG